MKTNLMLLCLAAGSLTVAPALMAEPATTTTTTTTTSEAWKAVPEDYEGDYYVHNNQFYHGGRHEVGEYDYEGHHYKDRYEHDGKWIYGGEWKHHARVRVEREK